ncbi:MAG: hypothetical protein KDK70_42430, partial [Myxococcales bacterium]|nr:hypothetical protein [Myxococcales bacterium]
IETWVLRLAAEPSVEESVSLKEEFKARFRGREHEAIRAAIEGWSSVSDLPSLADAHAELERLYPAP